MRGFQLPTPGGGVSATGSQASEGSRGDAGGELLLLDREHSRGVLDVARAVGPPPSDFPRMELAGLEPDVSLDGERRRRTPSGFPRDGASRARTGDLLGAIQALSQTEL